MSVWGSLIGDNTYHTDEDGFVYTGLSMPPNEINPEDESGGKYFHKVEVNTDEYFVDNQAESVFWNSDNPIIMYVYDR